MTEENKLPETEISNSSATSQQTKIQNDPFLSTKRQWNDYLASSVAAQKMWISISAVSLLLALICAFGMVYNSVQSKYIPYVIEVDKLGHVAPTSGPVDVSTFRNERVVRAVLASFIEDSRSVTPDLTVQATMIRRLYSKLNTSDPAIIAMNQYLNSESPNNPFNRSEREMVSIEIRSILQQSETTYYVEWDEHIRERSGKEKALKHMKALITIYIVEPTDFTEQMIRDNPAGIYIQNFSWQEIN